jgi:glucose-1-phosphate cytidylyltransferase
MKNLQAVLLAGGLGTRLSEETDKIPKPMVSIGGRPILWHIMKMYTSHNIRNFIICGGYKIDSIIEYFVNFRQHTSNLVIDTSKNEISYLNDSPEDWKITIINTGELTQTGGRLKRIQEYLIPNQPFLMTYGDGVSNVDITKLINFHNMGNFEATMTVVIPKARFGSVDLKDGKVIRFREKSVSEESYINGGFFVLNHSIFNLIENDQTVWEHSPLETLADQLKLGAYTHNGFWQPMDTLRDKRELELLWNSDNAPWKTWN